MRDHPEHIIRKDFPVAPVGVVRMCRGDSPVFIATFLPDRWPAVCAHFGQALTSKFEVAWCDYTVICAQT